MMYCNLHSNEGTQTFTCKKDESSLYQEAAKRISQLAVPNSIWLETNIGNAHYKVVKRGSFIKKGVEYPSMHIVEESNTICLPCGTYPETYLTCVNPESNNYKYYWMIPGSDGVNVKYGRIGTQKGEMFGEKQVQTPYPSRMFWLLYYEKLSKGYVDQSDIYLNKTIASKKTNTVKDERPVSIELYKKLRSYAKKVVEEHLVNSAVTEAQVKKSRDIFKKLCNRKSINGFNKQLLELIAVSPRNARYVDSLLAHSKEDFKDIIYREETLISAMEALVGGPVVTDSTSFKGLGISVYEATDEQKEKVIGKLSPTLQGKVKRVYRVINRQHQERFNSYLKKESVKRVKELWHGSRNENWLSIVRNGLQLHPDAVITGKMFGDGIYFAPSSDKSWGYTSGRGTYWAKGKDDVAFMGLYATAYGKPLDVNTAGQYSQRIVKNNGKNCVHAHAGTQLRNDEIIFYAEEAMLLNYIVEFAA